MLTKVTEITSFSNKQEILINLKYIVTVLPTDDDKVAVYLANGPAVFKLDYSLQDFYNLVEHSTMPYLEGSGYWVDIDEAVTEVDQ